MSSDAADTKIKILNASWRLLEAPEGALVRMSDIAKAAGISRQAVYLHYPSRAELLIATVRHIDEAQQVETRLAASIEAKSGLERLDGYIEFWAGYIPEVHGVCRALIAMKDTDPAVKAAWDDRMEALRQGCAAAVGDLKRDGKLNERHSTDAATDLLWMLMSISNWEQLTVDCGWSEERYVTEMKNLVRVALTG